MNFAKFGAWAFIVGLILAVVIALVSATSVPSWAVVVLAVLGVVVGLLNVTDREATTFLIASIAFLLSFQALSVVLTALLFGSAFVGTVFSMLSVFVAPATAIVALRVLFEVSRDR